MKINDRRGRNNGHPSPSMTPRMPTDGEVYIALGWLYAIPREQLKRVKDQFALDQMTKNPPAADAP